MAENGKDKPQASEKISPQSSSPLIFISHDSRDAELAEAFSKLLKSVSAGMLKSFRSSDKKGTEGIEYGDDWYKRLMLNLKSASDVVCLFTELSLERPWILYEAGVAKGKLDTPVLGISLGVSLSKVSNGPFYQFQNCADSEDSLVGLVMQLTRRISSLEPDDDVVKSQVQNFKSTVDTILSSRAEPGTEAKEEIPSSDAIAKQLEELKVMFREMPSLFEHLLAENTGVIRSRKRRKYRPEMFEEIMHINDMKRIGPIEILLFASLVQDDAPWLYEIAMAAFRALISGTHESIEQVIQSMDLLEELPIRTNILDKLGIINSEQSHMLATNGIHTLQRMVMRCLENRNNR